MPLKAHILVEEFGTSPFFDHSLKYVFFLSRYIRESQVLVCWAKEEANALRGARERCASSLLSYPEVIIFSTGKRIVAFYQASCHKEDLAVQNSIRVNRGAMMTIATWSCIHIMNVNYEVA